MKKSAVYEGTWIEYRIPNFKIDGLNIADISALDLGDLSQWFDDLPKKLSHNQLTVASEIIKEIKTRLQFINVGLNYLSFESTNEILSGGEAQRI